MTKWRGIRSAPRDGTEIIGWGPHFGRIIISWHEDKYTPWRGHATHGYPRSGFTHWMPIPGNERPSSKAAIAAWKREMKERKRLSAKWKKMKLFEYNFGTPDLV